MRNLFLLFFIMLLGVGTTSARNLLAPADASTSGAQLYDRWYAVLGTSPPDGNMPLWARQNTDKRTDADTWRCVECHGWDYKGSEGAFHSGSHATGFPGILKFTESASVAEILSVIKGSKDPSHNYSKLIDEANLEKLAVFLKLGVIDNNLFVDPITLKTSGTDADHGKKLYDATCANCHGADGTLIIFHTDGKNENISAVAKQDPYRFIHRTRFGVPGTEMPTSLDLGWKPSDVADVLAYTQIMAIGPQAQQTGAGDVTNQNRLSGSEQGNSPISGSFILSSLLVVIAGAFAIQFIYRRSRKSK